MFFLINFKLSKLQTLSRPSFQLHILIFLYLDIVDTRTSEHYEEKKALILQIEVGY